MILHESVGLDRHNYVNRLFRIDIRQRQICEIVKWAKKLLSSDDV